MELDLYSGQLSYSTLEKNRAANKKNNKFRGAFGTPGERRFGDLQQSREPMSGSQAACGALCRECAPCDARAIHHLTYVKQRQTRGLADRDSFMPPRQTWTVPD
jgi:hypothetical protein